MVDEWKRKTIIIHSCRNFVFGTRVRCLSVPHDKRSCPQRHWWWWRRHDVARKSSANDRLGRLREHHLLCKRIRLKMFRHFLNALSLAVIFFWPPQCRVLFVAQAGASSGFLDRYQPQVIQRGEMVASLCSQTSKAFVLITLVTMDRLHLHQLASDLTDQHQLNGHGRGQVGLRLTSQTDEKRSVDRPILRSRPQLRRLLLFSLRRPHSVVCSQTVMAMAYRQQSTASTDKPRISI